MNVQSLIELLDSNKDVALHIVLPNGEFVPAHFHVTEVGRVDKQFIDCGGTLRRAASCSLQAWTAHDLEHRLSSDKLSKILKLAQGKLYGLEYMPIEVEYGEVVASTYFLSDVEVTPAGLLFVLVGKQTDCLAPDKCGVSKCCSGTGCC